ncbi:unnamed protein product [Darwinula stevensoni]|uniref:Kringle domain-containing protein n=1 Tax=Darwinula stevensoni TaxID=69355 RepID=A0A7R9ACG0_9CRUS|nr:unnamed protein product [Darwinula stevensoni]CAG0900327.1 unnamed protein product [Darwinula stevensoni]
MSTFFPKGKGGNEDLQGMLLFAHEDAQHISILPVVPQRRSGEIWMTGDKLAQVSGEGRLSSDKRILFRGKTKVTWQRHTVTMLWSMDRKLAGLKRLSPDRSNVFTDIQIGRITWPLFITKEIDVVVLQKVLGSKRFHARCFVMQKSNLSDVQNILRVLKKGNDALCQDFLPKIISIPTLSTRLHHPHHPPHSEEDKNANTFRTFDQFTMMLFIWNLIRNPPECKLTWHGTEYVGKMNVTMWGFPCLQWLMRINEDEGRLLHDELDGGHAFCRNDVFSAGGPGCYVSLEMTPSSWRACDVPFCPTIKEGKCDVRVEGHCISPLECKTDVKGVSYIGTKNVTRKGHKCVAWIVGWMGQEEHDYSDYTEKANMISNFQKRLKDDLYPTHNFCRNWNDDDEDPWCYKSDGRGREYCDIPICTENVSEKYEH